MIYHNKYEFARGWVRSSVAYSVKTGEGDDRTLIQKDLGKGLELHDDPVYFSIFRDHVSGLEYIRNSKELLEKGLYVELGAYKYHVFIDFREVQDNEWHHYAQIARHLNGRGVPSIEDSVRKMILQPLQDAFKEAASAGIFRRLMGARITQPQAQLDQKFMDETEKKMMNLLQEAKQLSGGREDVATIAREVRQKLEAILYLPILTSRYPRLQPRGVKAAAEYLHKRLNDSPHTWATLFSWLFVHALGEVVNQRDFARRSRTWIDEWRLGETILSIHRDFGLDEAAAWSSLTVIKLLTGHQRWFEAKPSEQKQAYTVLESLLKENEVQQFLQVNQYNNTWWFSKEAFEEMLWWLMMVAALTIGSDPLRPVNAVVEELEKCYSIIQIWQEAEEESEYQVEKLLSILQK